ncbi:MAG: argininosuccinate lyase [bacterium]
MKSPVWQSRAKGTAREEFVAFAAGRDVVSLPEADNALTPYDIWTNQAHAIVLRDAGVYTDAEVKKIISALNQIEIRWVKGDWKLDPRLEDVHINTEAFVTEACGESLGGRLHTGRSRNDQVATDMKLMVRGRVLEFIEESLVLVRALLEHAREHTRTVMPGYTHHRKATVTSWGHWCAAYAQGLLRDIQRYQDLYERIDTCPLGAAASYGTSWPLDRRLAARLLAFEALQENTLDAVGSRGEAEAETVSALGFWLKRLSGLAQDIILFSTEEFGYLVLPADFTTGSSIMPQKRNPDFAEAIKGKMSLVSGYATALLSLNASNLGGYNKDMQWSKYAFLDAVREGRGAAAILAEVIRRLEVRRETMETAARTGFLNAVDVADHLARRRDLPFRQAYRIVSEAVGTSRQPFFTLAALNALLVSHKVPPLAADEFQRISNPFACLLNRGHDGSPSPRQVIRHCGAMEKKMQGYENWLAGRRRRIQTWRNVCARFDPAIPLAALAKKMGKDATGPV